MRRIAVETKDGKYAELLLFYHENNQSAYSLA